MKGTVQPFWMSSGRLALFSLSLCPFFSVVLSPPFPSLPLSLFLRFSLSSSSFFLSEVYTGLSVCLCVRVSVSRLSVSLSVLKRVSDVSWHSPLSLAIFLSFSPLISFLELYISSPGAH